MEEGKLTQVVTSKGKVIAIEKRLLNKYLASKDKDGQPKFRALDQEDKKARVSDLEKREKAIAKREKELAEAEAKVK